MTPEEIIDDLELDPTDDYDMVYVEIFDFVLWLCLNQKFTCSIFIKSIWHNSEDFYITIKTDDGTKEYMFNIPRTIKKKNREIYITKYGYHIYDLLKKNATKFVE